MIDNLTDFIRKIDNFTSLKPSEQIDYFGYFLIHIQNQKNFTPNQIKKIFDNLRFLSHTNIPKYLTDNSNKAKSKKKIIKFVKTKDGYHLLNSFETEIKTKIKEVEVPFISFSIDQTNLEWKPSDIPLINSKIKKNADFFTKLYFLLYHLENSLRKFLKIRLQSILGLDWEIKLSQTIDLSKAISIKNETDLSEMLQDRGNSILFYCMWDDYGKIIKQYPNIFSKNKDSDEVLAHLNSLAKIRNAIAHNTATIPQEYQDELTLFLKKYIKIMKNNNI